MTTHEKRLIYLLQQYADDIATQNEQEELKNMLNEPQHSDIITAALGKVMLETDRLPVSDERRLQAIWNSIKQADTEPGETTALPVAKVRAMNNSRRWWVAAAVLLLVSSSIYFFAGHQPQKIVTGTLNKKQPNNDVAPGGNKAMLTLSDGSKIVLDSAHNGTLAQQGNTKVIKLVSGQLVYSNIKEPTAAVLFNTLTTPPGGQYKVILPDATCVWLNASSSITYPTAFVGENRVVSITGEAYFEVAHLQNKDGLKPFTVKIIMPNGDGGQVEVLGTHFNVNAYADEPLTNTTLLQGSVKLISNNAHSMLKPGEQGQMNKAGNFKVIENANTEEAVAWKNGLFHFEDADVKMVMRQIARWYDVSVEFKGDITTEKFAGEISRNSNISEVFKILELSNIHFNIEGKKITVLP